ncbi:protein QUIRKY-like [Solanum tuberosum]|uniref:C2 domain-containing protein n=1 Tax=Solanum tuberosum TaxID=4113 RepID=M1DDC6_SOLTU|nr:PREDICTED: protein QUIRKY-like [Solanum tuberosum]
MSNQKKNQNQNPSKNQNANQNQNKNQYLNQNHNSYPLENEDFNLKETKPTLGGGRVTANDRLGTAFDLVEQMHYLYVRVVKAKDIPFKKDGNSNPHPFVEVQLGNLKGLTFHFEHKSSPEWSQVFVVLKDRIQSRVLEVCLKDKSRIGDSDDALIGKVNFEINEVPKRVPPDSPLAPQWYWMENRKGEKVKGELMLAVWIGTQADEAFQEALHLDATAVNGDGVANIKSKVYLSPRLWYLRVNVIEAQELQIGNKNRLQPEIYARITLGNVVLRTKNSLSKNVCPSWNEDLMFVVAEPFEDQLVLSVEDKVAPNKDELLGKCVISLQDVEKRVDFSTPISKWYGLEKEVVSEGGNSKVSKLNSKVHLRLSFDGGYHVLDELTHYSSDLKATSKELWKPSIGVLELGILNAQGLSPMKNRDGRGITDPYCVAKYGQKWIRTRTIINSFNPNWNEQYTWEVFDPCTVITIGVFDNCHLQGEDKNDKAKDSKIGKVRIRLSTLETNRVYTHSYPLIVLTPAGVKKMGEIQLAVRFSCSSLFNMLAMYSQPLLPTLHYLHPLTYYQIDNLRHQATQIVATRLSRAEPPLRRELVEYMLDVGSNTWSIRRCKANYVRIAGILTGLIAICKWFNGICTWKNPFTTVLVHIIFFLFVCFPRLILSSMFVVVFFIGTWNYRMRPRKPPHMDIKLSQAERVPWDELDEEFDTFPTSRNNDAVRMRYDRLRSIGSRMQAVAGDLANQGERFYNLLTWRDPRATALFLIFCLVASVVLYVTPFTVLVSLMGFYTMRHPKFREKLPSVPLSFFRRLPAKTDSLL